VFLGLKRDAIVGVLVMLLAVLVVVVGYWSIGPTEVWAVFGAAVAAIATALVGMLLSVSQGTLIVTQHKAMSNKFQEGLRATSPSQQLLNRLAFGV
jgi:hypothetical protein